MVAVLLYCELLAHFSDQFNSSDYFLDLPPTFFLGFAKLHWRFTYEEFYDCPVFLTCDAVLGYFESMFLRSSGKMHYLLSCCWKALPCYLDCLFVQWYFQLPRKENAQLAWRVDLVIALYSALVLSYFIETISPVQSFEFSSFCARICHVSWVAGSASRIFVVSQLQDAKGDESVGRWKAIPHLQMYRLESNMLVAFIFYRFSEGKRLMRGANFLFFFPDSCGWISILLLVSKITLSYSGIVLTTFACSNFLVSTCRNIENGFYLSCKGNLAPSLSSMLVFQISPL